IRTLVLCEKCRGSSGNESACSRSFNNKEDYPIRIYSALKINADYTITRNRKDFLFSDITIFTPKEFLSI
ncbi:hypothetical protein ABG828_10485, partial [Phocaeicola vulgatus]|nr:hypothetical protein [Phocaeicola vulgatus]MDB0822757.1 hypothetical protein [Phocaeicola vulgatus]